MFVVLIGHGTYEGKVAKFNLPGPDMTPEDFETQLKRVRSRHIVFVNTASASGPFMQALAAPGRTIVTATRTGAERFATLFGGYFADALAGTEADADKNRRVSVLEAFTYAKREVGVAYEREGIMLTEHAVISDNGDREGTQTPAPDGESAAASRRWSRSGSTDATDPLPSDPKLRALYTERRDIERRIEALKLLKDSMEPSKYTSELERLATDLALKTRADSRGGRKARRDGAPRDSRSALVVLLIATAAAAVFAQGFGRNRRSGPQYEVQGNTPYDGRFVFVRLRYNSGFGGGGLRTARCAVVARLPGRRGPLLEDPRGDHAAEHPHRRLEHPGARRSGAVQLSDRLHGGARASGGRRTRRRRTSDSTC